MPGCDTSSDRMSGGQSRGTCPIEALANGRGELAKSWSMGARAPLRQRAMADVEEREGVRSARALLVDRAGRLGTKPSVD